MSLEIIDGTPTAISEYITKKTNKDLIELKNDIEKIEREIFEIHKKIIRMI